MRNYLFLIFISFFSVQIIHSQTIRPKIRATSVRMKVKPIVNRTFNLNAARKAPDFVTTPKGQTIALPKNSVGPLSVKHGTGAKYIQKNPVSKNNGLHRNTAGVRIMDASKKHEKRVVYMNKSDQTIDSKTGRTIPKTDKNAHLPLK